MTLPEPTPEFTGHNGGPPLTEPTPFDIVVTKIEDLYDEAKNWADGEPITSPDIAEAITTLFDGLGAAGKEAEALRVAEVKPLDEAKTAIQARFHPLIGDTKAGKGKVVLGRAALQVLLTAWRVEQQRVAALAAAKAREEAAALQAEAEAALRASAGNLEAREAAEEVLSFAKEADKFARRTEKAATTRTGLRTEWITTLVDEGAALDWAYTRDPRRFQELVQSMAETEVRNGVRSVPGFTVIEGKRAA